MNVIYHVSQYFSGFQQEYSSTELHTVCKTAYNFYQKSPNRPLIISVEDTRDTRRFIFFDTRDENVLHFHYLNQTETITSLEQLLTFSDRLVLVFGIMTLKGIRENPNSDFVNRIHLFFKDRDLPFMNPFYSYTMTPSLVVNWQKEGF